jgi:[glutamine synthetase] adenylyltransferase / [glutamine synthetase]-adenylyl-L-tyrosine phosphorylase
MRDHAPLVDTQGPPRAADPARLEQGLARLRRAVERDPALAPLLGDGEPPAAPPAAIAAILGSSPYLSDILVGEPRLAQEALTAARDVAERVIAEVLAIDLGERARVMAALRRHKRRMHLVVALAELAGLKPGEGPRLHSRFADAACGRALAHLLIKAAERGELDIADGSDPERGTGLFVLGMGKLGAFELNFSSDIDLIVLLDEQAFPYRGQESPTALAVRVTRGLVHLLDERTRDGYVFRTDLRLRPHPPGQPLALPTDAAELYYERHGQNWERAALIKARVVAGDRAAGEGFLDRIAPFLWRRHLDYAAINDIHSIKRQINAHRGFGTIRVEGHDLKVGRGGIREIEFFAQTQQLILGGRVPELRVRGTIEALEALVAERWLAEDTARELTGCYRFLRAVEDRLQMVADKQTHRLPDRAPDLDRFAAFMGFEDGEALARAVRHTLERVESHYAALFETGPDLGDGGSLVFTGTEDDPDTIATITRLGFADARAVAGRIRAWHHGHVPATRSTRARELLTELVPSLLRALARQADPDGAFRLFDRFVSGLPSGVQVFSLFRANPRLLGLLADLMGLAPRLAPHLSDNVDLFDAMLTPDFFEPLPDAAALEAELEVALADARDLQDVLDVSRRWAHGRQFQAGVQVLLGATTAEAAATTLTAIAEIVIRRLLPRVRAWLEEQHGRIPGRFVVLGLGKLGSRELTIGSDLDLIFVYDAPDDAVSGGERPLPAHQYFPRLGQRLVSALTAKTAEGTLFEIDTRLRPSGHVGPVASGLASFEAYQHDTAQIWEHQALTRARVVAGDEELAGRVSAILRDVLARQRDPAEVAREVRSMRERIFREHGDDDPWNLKHAPGGIVELEFTAQYLQLAHAHAHPALLDPAPRIVLERAAEAGLVARDHAKALIDAGRLYQRLQAVLRLSLSERFDAGRAPQGLREALVRAAYPPAAHDGPPVDFATLERNLGVAQTTVRRVFLALTGTADGRDMEDEA